MLILTSSIVSSIVKIFISEKKIKWVLSSLNCLIVYYFGEQTKNIVANLKDKHKSDRLDWAHDTQSTLDIYLFMFGKNK